ncbi:MAG: potassium/proton antiporter [Halorhodospira halophila]|uniref:potassium/proton antiporter n=1 Tax=Halorhodospira TaxID=85108 RepID=UPI001EE7B561|nr:MULTISPECIES: potassium/proton antiporter [Halorhodospira]MCC3750467.1 potassium/proton antiporter [Halorhodospira halophila]MCG5528739.1 potassium/proton antiporter [Halorhodospira halophila]MCG5539269.1 potassium/proton antiporter [Halorhodospira sp. 9622]MCG5543350.1 potassium/proton antiporter [Halorhodospira sp. 9628]
MDLTNQLILFGAALLLVSILASVVSDRVGAPMLLVFLAIGMLLGEEGLFGIDFDDIQAAHLIGSLALAIILFDGGLRTQASTFRVALKPALTLATVGVIITAGITGGVLAWAFDLDWKQGLLIGAIVGSTDAAAVFGLLHARGLELKQRVAATLEIESGSNDPMAIFLTIMLVEILVQQPDLLAAAAALEFVQQLGLGAAFGALGGLTLAWLINRINLTPGLYPLLALGGGLAIFGGAAVLGGSGFLAVYLAGLIAGNRRLQAAQNIRRFHDGFAWLAQITMFVVLGLLVTPSELLPVAAQGLLAAAVLILVARPLAVFACLAPFRFPWREQLFISWVGLRGAVPIILGLFPLLAGIEQAELFFNVAFFVVLVSLVVQGWTIAPAARLLGLEVPPDSGATQRQVIDVPHQTDYAFIAYRITESSPALYEPINRLNLPSSAQPVALFREGEALQHPRREVLRPRDYLYLLALPRDIADLDRLFVAPSGPAYLAEQRFFGEFTLDGSARLGDIATAYGISMPSGARPEQSLSDYLLWIFNNRAVVGDRVRIDNLQFTIREIQDGRIAKVGMRIGQKG